MYHFTPRWLGLHTWYVFALACILIVASAIPVPPTSAADPAFLVKDIRTTSTGNGGSYAQGMYLIGNTAYFFAFDPDHGVELWKSDGTESGTVLVKDLNPGPHLALRDTISGFESPQFTGVGNTVFFVVDDGSYGHELWRSDGTEAGTIVVKDIYPGTTGSNPTQLTNVNGTLFFVANDGIHGTEIWRSDGTEQGTAIVEDMSPGTTDSYVFNLTAVGNELFFGALVIGTESSTPLAVWKSDGTESGTKQVHTLTYPCWWQYQTLTNALTDVQGQLFFVNCTQTEQRELWQSDGTDSGTTKIMDLPGSYDEPSEFTPVGDTLFFRTNNQLWKSDGTADGTVLVKAVKPSHLANVNNTLFFAGDDGVAGNELWRSDGSADGTVTVKDIYPGTPASHPINITQAHDGFFFAADDGTNGYELWRSDGTSSGTILVRDIHLGSGGSFDSADVQYPWSVLPNGTVLFPANDGVSGEELWRSDGTTEGTTTVRDIGGNRTDGTDNYYDYYGFNSHIDVNGVLFFTANGDDTGRELWRSDGTQAGTFLVKDIAPGSQSSYPDYFTNVNGTLFFTADDGVHGSELWRSDGTEAGTQMVIDLVPGSQFSYVRSLVSMNGVLFFDVYTNQAYTLWRSDGTAAGTTKIKDIDASYLTVVNDELFFVASNQLWKSDGTTSGTVSIKSVGGVFNYSPSFTLVNGILFFPVRRDPTNTDYPAIYSTYDLWRSDGTSDGTILLKTFHTQGNDPNVLTGIRTMGDKVYFAGADVDHGTELWSSDGTPEGTQLVADMYPGQANSTPMNLVNVNNTLFFNAVTADAGRELWQSDGTTAGTTLVKDIEPGVLGSNATPLLDHDGTLLLKADDGVSGTELWRSDGTSYGTSLVQDIAPGHDSSAPSDLVESNGLLFFNADDQVHGFELWALHLPLAALPTATPTSTATATPSPSPTITSTVTATPPETATTTATATASPTPGLPITSLPYHFYMPEIVH